MFQLFQTEGLKLQACLSTLHIWSYSHVNLRIISIKLLLLLLLHLWLSSHIFYFQRLNRMIQTRAMGPHLRLKSYPLQPSTYLYSSTARVNKTSTSIHTSPPPAPHNLYSSTARVNKTSTSIHTSPPPAPHTCIALLQEWTKLQQEFTHHPLQHHIPV